jgi:hypothetical protein
MSEAVQQRSADDATPSVRFWEAPWEFAVHTLVGTLIFCIIAAPAVILHIVLDRLEAHYDIGAFLNFGLTLAEYAIFVTDLILFAVFLWRTAARTIKKL